MKNVMIGDDTNKIIKKLFHSLLHRYQIGLEQSMKGSNFISYHVSEMYYVCQNTNRLNV